MSIFFCIPLLINRLQLSSLQANQWDDETYLLLIFFVTIFSIIPSMFIFNLRINKTIFQYENIFVCSDNKVTILLLIGIISQFLLNKLNSGYYIPSLNILETETYHTISVGFWGPFISVYWSFIVVIGVINGYYKKKIKIYVLLFFCLLVPILTRFSRMSLVGVLIPIFFFYKDVVPNKKRFYLKTTISVILLISLGISVMFYRWSYGVNNVSMIKTAQLNRSVKNETIATFYTYFALNFENIDRFIKQNKNNMNLTYGLYAGRPLTIGVFKLHKIIPELPRGDYVVNQTNTLSGVANVETAVPGFAIDFGVLGSIITMSLYSFFALLIYINGRKYVFIRLIYLYYCISYILSSFQNIFFSESFPLIVIFLYIFLFSKKDVIITKKLNVIALNK
jgi:oligosaccharide repeat unit polymerase